MLKLLSFGWIWTFLVIVLIVAVIIFMFNSKSLVDNFADLDLSCEAVQNKYYHAEELSYKSRCPNLVIVEKLIGGRVAFFCEMGDHNGPFFSKDYVRYYYMGVSPNGVELDLDYDLYHYPWYNPYRWFHRPYGFHRRRRGHWRRDLYDKWNDYSDRIDRRNRRLNRRIDERIDERINRRLDNRHSRPNRTNRPNRPNRPFTPRRSPARTRTPTRTPTRSPSRSHPRSLASSKKMGTLAGASARL